jgi:hypothetical protein
MLAAHWFSALANGIGQELVIVSPNRNFAGSGF